MEERLSLNRGASGNINSFNYSNSFNQHSTVNINTGTDDERRQILEWLSPLEPRQRHQSVRTDRLDGVGDWLLETNEFQKWCDLRTESEHVQSVLFCSGKPGVGKTYLSSLVIDNLCDKDGGKDIAVAGLYCDFLTHEEQSATNMVGAILKQLVGGDEIPDFVRQAFKKAKTKFGGRGLRLPELVGMLKTITSMLPHVFICIDALDESVPKHRVQLLGALQEIAPESPSTRIFLTGRPYVEDEVATVFHEAIIIPITPNEDDIRSYLEARLKADTEPHAMDDDLRADILKVIPQTISTIFLLVSLNIEAILGEMTIYRRRRKLEEMTKGKGLGDAYTATLERVKAQSGSKSKLGMDVLMWISHPERPLRANELCHALGVERGSSDLNIQNIPAIETLLGCCLGLVTVEVSSSTVRPVHFTLQEYLSNNPALFHSPHSMIAEVCLTYLNFKCVRDLSPALLSAPPTTPLVEYASYYWWTHARKEISECMKSLAFKILDGYDEHISSKLLLLHKETRLGQPFDQSGSPRGFTGLHGVAYLGSVELTLALLELKEWDLQETDLKGNTAFMWAAKNGHEGVVKILLEREDIKPDTPDTRGQTPLSWAAENGHEEVVKILLGRKDVSPYSMDRKGLTPFSWAAGNGHEGVLRILLGQKDINPDTVDKRGRTPLLRAFRNGHRAVVKILSARHDVNPNPVDEDGRTSLYWAAGNGYEEIVKLLLGRDNVNPDIVHKGGRTPLSWAAENGHEGVVKMLLERNEVSPDTVDFYYGRTPLSWAAGKGHEGVVKMLLGRAEVNPGAVDAYYGRTPLSWAAGKGHKGVVKLFLARDDVSPDTIDTYYGRTPISWAACNGYDHVVKMLLSRRDVSPETADKNGRTPLSLAAEYGREETLKMLLDREDVNPETADKNGRTPLSWATARWYGREETLKILLDREDVNSEKADNGGRTPLSWVARKWYLGIARLLLERDDVNPDTADDSGLNSQSRIANLLSKYRRPLPEETSSELSTELHSHEPSEPPSIGVTCHDIPEQNRNLPPLPLDTFVESSVVKTSFPPKFASFSAFASLAVFFASCCLFYLVWVLFGFVIL